MLIAAFVALVGIVVFAQRRELARAQAAILGGSIGPGCVVAEAIVLLLIAAAMLLFG
ncbi:MAG TPA: hypothetical protein VHK90_06930 [Thermoanaerobaculia bacterium]|nr:hypothetical protein [Thermoanaerobaculia bacterium]